MEKKKIVLIDDEASFGRLLKLNIEENQQYEAFLATSGVEGIELVKQHKPDLVLLDIIMPGMNGLETLQRIKAISPGTPVAMVTACWDEQEGKRALAAGAYDYITKPVDFEHLHNALLVKLFH